MIGFEHGEGSQLRPGEFPVDLRQWTRDTDLVRLALEEAQALSSDPERRWSETEAAAAGQVNEAMMLTLLTYAYAIGLGGSREIEWQIAHDPNLRYICARQFPDWNLLRKFRRRHLGPLTGCLARVFMRAAGQAPVPLNSAARVGWTERCWEEARSRLLASILADSMELDE